MESTPLAEPSDADLATAWSAGDERAYDHLVARYAPLVFARCRRSLGAVDADDATQAVFLVLARRRGQAAASPVLAAWLMTVANHVVLRAQRDRQRRRAAERGAPPPPPAADDPVPAGFEVHLDACLAELPAREREAVVLHHLAGRTLAEVSAETGSGLSTVKYRLARGLERLRALMTARGVALGSAALAAALATEAQAAAPAEVLVHLRDLATAGGGAGTTADPSDRARRWSRERPSAMTRIAIAAAGILLVGGAVWQFLPSAESAPRAAQPPPARPVATAAPGASPMRSIDPARARSWFVVRVAGSADTAARLRLQPEAVLLRPAQLAWIDRIAGIREAALIIDPDSLIADDERVGLYRTLQEMAGLPPDRRRERQAQALQESSRHERERLMSDLRAAAQRGERRLARPVRIPAMQGWLVAGDAAAQIEAFAAAADPAAGLSRAAGGWSVPSVAGPGELRVTGDRAVLAAAPAAAQVPAAVLAAAKTAGGALLTFTSLLDPGRTGQAPVVIGSGSLRVGVDGLRFAAESASAGGPPQAAIDRAVLDRVPQTAFAAGLMRMSRGGEHGLGARLRSLVAEQIAPVQAMSPDGLPPGLREAVETITILLDEADGHLVCWLEPGSPMPVLTVEIDIADAAADRVLAATGLARRIDGSVQVTGGTLPFALGHRTGGLVLTTRPDGLAGIGHDGFTAHPEVRAALAALPAGGLIGCVVVRPAATLDAAGSWTQQLFPDLQAEVARYRGVLASRPAFGTLAFSDDGVRSRIEATGILAAVGGLVIAGQAVNPASRLLNAD